MTMKHTQVSSLDAEGHSVKVKCMQLHGINKFKLPSLRDDICWYHDWQVPEAQGLNKRSVQIEASAWKYVQQQLQNWAMCLQRGRDCLEMRPSDLSVIFCFNCSPLKKHFYSCSTVECFTFTVQNDVWVEFNARRMSLTLKGHINVSFWASLFNGWMQVEWIKTSLFNW